MGFLQKLSYKHVTKAWPFTLKLTFSTKAFTSFFYKSFHVNAFTALLTLMTVTNLVVNVKKS